MDSVRVDRLMEVFGSEKFSGDESPGSDWSPNMYKHLYILPSSVVSVDHFGRFEALNGSNEGFSVEDMAEVVNTRRLSSLEGIYVHPSLGGLGLATELASCFQVGTERLHSVGECDDALKVTASTELPGSEGWEGRVHLQPEHYPFDAEGKKLHRLLSAVKAKFEADSQPSSDFDDMLNELDSDEIEEVPGEVEGEPEDYEEVSVEDEDEVLEDSEDEVPEEEEDSPEDSEEADLRSDVDSYFRGAVNGTINKILREYRDIFSSGYEVIVPAGILMESDRGRGVLGRLKGNNLERDRPERNLQFLYERLRSDMNLVEAKVRSVREIANILVTGKDSNGKRLQGTVIFPYKMMEYAYGQRHVSSDQDSLSVYQGHAKASSWEDYAREEVAESLREAILESIWAVLKTKGLEEDPSGPEANSEAASIMEKFETAFCTCILVSVFDAKDDGELVQLKVRILDPTGVLPRNHNLLEDIIDEAYGDVRGSDTFRAYDVRRNEGAYVEYAVELDTKLANAEPLFAYKALDKVLERGQKLDFDNAIFGKDTNDKILRNGGKINLNNRLAHLVVAGSRAGKGVWTFSGLAANVLSRRPVFYLDNKPDMASLFRNYGPNCFVVNGANITTDPDNGTDYFRQFADEDSKIRPDHIPAYVADMLGGAGYRQIGDFVYSKALVMAMGILAARVEVPSALENLGGKEGILIVVDELANANSGLMSRFGVLGRLMASTGYYAELKAGVEESKIKAAKPTEAGYWFTHFYKGLQDSLTKLQMLSNAGLKNVEANRSDVFVLTQEPPSMVRSVSEVNDMFKSPYKTTNGVNGIDDYRILPSLAIVGGADVFIGYDKDGRRFLNQGDKSSPSFNYLNEVARNFGYLNNYTQETIDQFNTSKLAEKAIYYKPFLLFADGRQDSYFVQNALGYSEKVGANKADIIARNRADNGDPTQINPAVGFMEYLGRAGITQPEATEVLNKSGQIAQFITSRMGYPGTWQEFLMDFRPEWMFTVDDVINAAKGIPLAESNQQRLADFIMVYPEAFPESFRVVSDDYAEEYINEYDDVDLSAIGDGFDGGGFETYSDDFHQGDDGDAEEFASSPEFFDPGVPDIQPVVDVPSVQAPEVVTYEDTFGSEGLYDPYDHSPSQGGSTAELNPNGFHVSPETHIPSIGGNHFGDTDELSESPLAVNWNDPEGARQALEYFNELEDRKLINSEWGARPTGGGTYYSPTGERDDYRVSPEGRVPIRVPGNGVALSEPKSIGTLVREITAGAIQVAGGHTEVISIRVIDGMLVINNIAYRPRFTREYIASMPVDLRNEVRNGKLARLFSWAELRHLPRVTRLSFDDLNMVYDYVSPDLGWGSRASVDMFFREFNSLQSFTIGGTVFSRRTYRSQLAEDPTFYQPRRARAAIDSLDRSFTRGTSSSWQYTKTTFSRNDISAGKKALGLLAGATSIAVVGTGAVTAKGTRAAADGLRKGFRALGDAFNNNRRY